MSSKMSSTMSSIMTCSLCATTVYGPFTRDQNCNFHNHCVVNASRDFCRTCNQLHFVQTNHQPTTNLLSEEEIIMLHNLLQ